MRVVAGTGTRGFRGRWGGDIHDSMQSIRLRGSHAFGFGLSLSDLSRRSETIPLTQMLNAFTSSGQ